MHTRRWLTPIGAAITIASGRGALPRQPDLQRPARHHRTRNDARSSGNTMRQADNGYPSGIGNRICNLLLYMAAQLGEMLRTTLTDMGYPQGPTPIVYDNTIAGKMVNNTCKLRRSRAIDMRFHWIRDRVAQGHFTMVWRPGTQNLADFLTKAHPVHHFTAMAPFFDGQYRAEQPPLPAPSTNNIRASGLNMCLSTSAAATPNAAPNDKRQHHDDTPPIRTPTPPGLHRAHSDANDPSRFVDTAYVQRLQERTRLLLAATAKHTTRTATADDELNKTK